MSRDQKGVIRGKIRGAYKVWENRLMGNAQLFRAVVKYGFIKPKTLSAFMYAFKQMQIEASSSGDSHPTARRKEELRNRALKARANLREAKRLTNTAKPKQLSVEQEQLLDK